MKHLLILAACSVAAPVSYSTYLAPGGNSIIPPVPPASPAGDLPLAEPQELELYQSSTCSPLESIYRIPLTGECQQIPSWIHDDEWQLGVKLARRFSVRFYSDENCAEFISPLAVPYAATRSAEPDCQDLGGLGLSPGSFRLI